jgi:hypothetical protein
MQLTRMVFGTLVSLASLSACSSEPGATGSRINGGGPKSPVIQQGAAAGTGSLIPNANPSSTLPSSAAPGGMVKLPEGVCAAATITATRSIPTVYLVIDGSSSMNAPFGGGTRWRVLRDALVGANGVVTKLETVVKFGMTLYGNSNPMMCPTLVEVKPPALNNLATMVSMYPEIEVGGGTPTGEALQIVVDGLPDFSQPTLDGVMEKAPIIILATDGEPNGCNVAIAAALDCLMTGDLEACAGDLLMQAANAAATYDSTLAAVRTAKEKQIPVWVVSLAAGLNTIPDLQRTANIGAGLDENASPPATIYSPENPDDLTNTLTKLIGDVVDCTVALNGTLDVKRACEGTVNMNGNPLECNGPDGWVPADNKHITLQGVSCATFKSDPAVFLDARFPCGVVQPD